MIYSWFFRINLFDYIAILLDSCDELSHMPFRCFNGSLSHRGLITPYGDIDLGKLLVQAMACGWRHQDITWFIVDLLSQRQ